MLSVTTLAVVHGFRSRGKFEIFMCFYPLLGNDIKRVENRTKVMIVTIPFCGDFTLEPLMNLMGDQP